MKKYFLVGLIVAIMPNICAAESASVSNLIREKQRKMEELEKCMGTSKGLKIAGISTLGVTAAGVAGNIVEAKVLSDYDKKIETADKKIESAKTELAKKQQEAAQNKKVIIKSQEAEDENMDEESWQSEGQLEAVGVMASHRDMAEYTQNCESTGGRIINGMCTCVDGSASNMNGKCGSEHYEDSCNASGGTWEDTWCDCGDMRYDVSTNECKEYTNTEYAEKAKLFRDNCESTYGDFIDGNCVCPNNADAAFDGKCPVSEQPV